MRNKFSFLILLVYLSIISVFLYTHQNYNADIEAYMGLVYKFNNPDMDIKEIHQKVYDELKIKSPKLLKADSKSEEEIIGGSTYYKKIYENSLAYKEELQFFSVKPLYNIINSLFFKIGFSASSSTFLITIISYVSILLLSFIFFVKNLKNSWLSLIFTILLSLFKPLLDASRHATPDVFSCFLLLISFYFFIRKRNIFISTFFAILCILTRPEYFIFYSFIFILIYMLNNSFFLIKLKNIILSYICLLTSFTVIQYFNKISWKVLFMNQFIKVQLFPISHPDPFVFSDYLYYIKTKIFFEFNSSFFLIFLIFILLFLIKTYIQKNENFTLYVSFYIIIYLSVFIRFLIFPSLVNRMMIGYYLLIIISLIVLNLNEKSLKNYQ